MNITAFIVILGLSVIIFMAPAKLKWHFAFGLQVLIALLTGWSAIEVLIFKNSILDFPFLNLLGKDVHLVIDSL